MYMYTHATSINIHLHSHTCTPTCAHVYTHMCMYVRMKYGMVHDDMMMHFVCIVFKPPLKSLLKNIFY